MNTTKIGRGVIRELKISGVTWREERLSQRRRISQSLIRALLKSEDNPDGLSQKEIGSIIGVSQATISYTLTGRTTLSFSSLSLLLDEVNRRKIKLPVRVTVWRPL